VVALGSPCTRVIAEYQNGAAPSSPTREYIYSGASLLAKIESGAVQYYHPDQLSVRVMTDSSGNVIGQQDHYPFGESWYQSSTTTKWFFTSYERDTESGNDYASFRYYGNRFGRFASPDLLAGSRSDPQSLNRYAYVRGDPVNLVDPLGLTNCNPADELEGYCTPGGESNDAPVYATFMLQYGADSCPVCDLAATGFDPSMAPVGPSVSDEWATFSDVNGVFGSPSFDPGTVGEEWGGQAPSHGGGAGEGPAAAAAATAGSAGGSAAEQQPSSWVTFAESFLTNLASPQTPTPWYKNSCVTGALGKGALSVGIDSIGLIPEAGGIARVIGHQAGYVGVVADQAGSRLIGAVNATANTGRGLAGLTDTSPTGLASTGLTIAGFIPGLNDAAAVGSIGLDLFRTAKAIGACY
jgi:RHS repeat-associated protein